MSANFAVFIGLCYLAFATTCALDGKLAWAGVGLCWGVGNMLIAYLMNP